MFMLQLETIDKLNALVAKEGKTQAKVIDQALTAYASGSLSDKDLLERLDALAENDDKIQKSIEELRPILTAALKELQGINKT
jgi:predicted DNA-binding protein